MKHSPETIAKIRESRANALTWYERMWANIDVRGPDECWNWLRAANRGHRVLWVKPKLKYPYRLIWEMRNGPVPDGLVLDHMCRNGMCCNPRHLRAVTRRVNTLENNDNPWAKNRRKTHCKHGHPLAGENVAWLMLPRRGNDKTKQLTPCRQCLTCYPSSARSKYRVDPPASTV